MTFDKFQEIFAIAEDHPAHIYNSELQYIKKCKSLDELLKHPFASFYCFWYARFVIWGSFPDGESVISNDEAMSLKYAEEVLEGPFLLGEAEIAKNAMYAYNYARYILKNNFPKGEAAIKTSYFFNQRYERFLDTLKDA